MKAPAVTHIEEQARFYRLADKVYDVETGTGELECVKRTDGKFDLVVYCGDQDLTMYGLSPRELTDIGSAMIVLAASVDPKSILNRK